MSQLTMERKNRRHIGIRNLGLLSFTLSMTASVPLSFFPITFSLFVKQI